MKVSRRNNFQNNVGNNAIHTELVRVVEETFVARKFTKSASCPNNQELLKPVSIQLRTKFLCYKFRFLIEI